jgi:cytochrome c551/c552
LVFQIFDQLAEKELLKYKPNGLYLHSDNHPPFINYVLVAKKLRIPTITYQHGLDCEHFYLDDCFADYVAVWSDNRKQKYISYSQFQPKDYKVVGNYFLDKAKSLKNKNLDCNTVLFITRPHKPIKCYSPSRSYYEGIDILKVLIKFLRQDKTMRLIVKPHPMDNVDDFEMIINEEQLKDRVKFVTDNLNTIIEDVSIVVTEDSTAGVEALRYGLPCVHAHFAQSKPVLPFNDYNAAYFAENEETLIQVLEKAKKMSEEDVKQMQVGQQNMVKSFLPQGKAEDLVNFIIKNT